MSLYVSQLKVDLARTRSANPEEERFKAIFLMATRSALREIAARTPLDPTIIEADDEDTGLDPEHEYYLGVMIDHYITTQNEWGVDSKRETFALKENALIKIRRAAYVDDPPTGVKGGTRA